ncbi:MULTISPECIES: hypothetical protein [Hymenobacter]|uniref:Uncharacterized protein n=1 Tax=Hymenobacter fodinae TaxID=2510796 RepID=A0A4Z0P4W0_9BACT|nr:hypothetical protein [Hymenobacter fodinae]TGE06450.1 hypothetical protein EU556_16555 [Hymenobacter fodinae]
MKGYHYRFAIRGYSHPLLFDLSAHNPSPDLAFMNEEYDSGAPQFFFTSAHLDELSEPAQVWGRARQLLDMFHGIYVLASLSPNSPFGSARPVLYNLYDLWADKGLDSETPDEPSKHPYTATVLAEPVHPVYSSGPMSQALLLARTEPDVLTLLTQLGQELDLRTLYAIVDTLRHYESDFDGLLQTAGISNAKYKLFTRTADNFGASGLLARHGPSNNQPPANPMPLSEAQYLVKLLSRQYLTDHHGIQFPEPIVYEDAGGMLEDF